MRNRKSWLAARIDRDNRKEEYMKRKIEAEKARRAKEKEKE